jgi:hypothetical protein
LRHAVLVQVFPFGGGLQLSISIDEPNAIMRGAGLHRLICRVALDERNAIAGGVPVALSGWAWPGMTRMDWLGGWSTERPVVTRQDQPFDATLVLPHTDDQIAAIRKQERTLGQRLGMLRHALHGLASLAAHGDDVAAEVKWDRENALAVIAGVAALAACRGQQTADKW